MENCRRQTWARFPKTVKVSGTATVVTSLGMPVMIPSECRTLSSTITPRTPRLKAWEI